VVDAGYAADHGGKLGTANLAMTMLDEGAGNLDALAIDDRLERLGANLTLGADLDTAIASVSALKANLADTLDLYADIVLAPTFPGAELERLRSQTLAGIQQEMNEPLSMALRLFPRLLYGDDHAYAMPFTGTGTLTSVPEISREDLLAYHRTWFRPGNATLIVTGDTTMAEVLPMLRARFGAWPAGDTPAKDIGPVDPEQQPVIYVVDRKGSEQSKILAGHVVPPYDTPDRLALEAANSVIGGTFTSRINMNLREDKHWSYGARSIIPEARGPQPFFVYAPVQTDRTAESMAEIHKELHAFVSDEPPMPEEVTRVKDQSILTLPGRWETQDAVLTSLKEIVRFGLNDDYWTRYPERIRALDVAAVSTAARRHIHPERLTWVVIGDWAEIGDAVEALDIGEIRQVEAGTL
jgi:zinc protease